MRRLGPISLASNHTLLSVHHQFEREQQDEKFDHPKNDVMT
jgi:hypothetical protein